MHVSANLLFQKDIGVYHGHCAFPSQRAVTRSYDVFFDLRLKNGWVNSHDTSDLRHNRAHYDAIVMMLNIRVVDGYFDAYTWLQF